MNNTQINQLARIQKVVVFLTDHAAELTATPAIASIYLPQLQSLIAAILSNDTQATLNYTGFAIGKAELRTALETITDHIAGALAAYALAQNNVVLQTVVAVPSSSLRKMRDGELREFAKYVLEKAAPAAVATELAAQYNASAQDLTLLAQSIAAFEAQIVTPQHRRAESRAYGKVVDSNLASANAILTQLRSLMRSYKKTNRLLYEIFEATDTIDNYGHGKKAGNISGILTPNEGKLVCQLQYHANTPITLTCTTATPIVFRLYLQGQAVGTTLTVLGNSTVSTTLGQMANHADALHAQNTSPISAAGYQLTV